MIGRAVMAQPKTDVPESPLLGYSRWALAVTVAAMPSFVWRFKVGPIPTTPDRKSVV